MSDDLLHIFSETAGIITIVISTAGLFVALSHFVFFNKSNNKLAKKIKTVFLADAMIYMITGIFGVWAYLEWSFETAIFFQYVRIPILLLNVWASWRLYKHYKNTHIK